MFFVVAKKVKPVFNCFWCGPVADLLRNTVALESIAYDKSLSTYDPECQKIIEIHYSHYGVKR